MSGGTKYNNEAKTCGWTFDVSCKLDVVEVKCWQSICGMTRIKRWRIQKMRISAVAILSFFVHVECLSGSLLTRRVYKSEA